VTRRLHTLRRAECTGKGSFHVSPGCQRTIVPALIELCLHYHFSQELCCIHRLITKLLDLRRITHAGARLHQLKNWARPTLYPLLQQGSRAHRITACISLAWYLVLVSATAPDIAASSPLKAAEQQKGVCCYVDALMLLAAAPTSMAQPEFSLDLNVLSRCLYVEMGLHVLILPFLGRTSRARSAMKITVHDCVAFLLKF
jgi:hypothetical protein